MSKERARAGLITEPIAIQITKIKIELTKGIVE